MRPMSMSKNLIRRSLAVAGVVALALGVAADVAAVAAQPAGRHSGRAPFATRAESLKLARRLLAKAVLPPGTRRFLGRKLPEALSAPPEETSATPLIDVHRVFAGQRSMRRTASFLEHHHPAGWTYDGTGSGGFKNFVTSEYVTYVPRHLRPAFRDIEMLVNVAPARHGHALARVDIQLVWSRRKPAAEYLVARHFRVVRVDEWTRSHHVRRTFRQRAIIDKLIRVLNPLPVASGGTWSCPAFGPGFDGRTVRLTFEPVRGRSAAVVAGFICPPGYAISIGKHSEPALTDNGKVEAIARMLMRSSHQPKR